MAQITIGVRLSIAMMLGGTQLLPLDMAVGAGLAEIWMPSHLEMRLSLLPLRQSIRGEAICPDDTGRRSAMPLIWGG